MATYSAYPDAYAYNEDGKTYAAVFVWDPEAIHGVYDSFVGSTNTVAYLKALAGKFRTIGYDGVMVMAVMAPNGGTITATSSTLSSLRKDGALVVNAGYETRYATDAT
ncbi:hypothetical protein [Sinomonas mesophila]|uniref:hypothetical protein n=1 Tax=Sinomonas mesophila TaxID=1531955 RepID=UPI0009859458|nr:hypothetical protein [Sinomonas mesophila]